MSRHSVAVVGAGWAGLAAAVDLVSRDFDVTVLEAAAEPGGRARALDFDGNTLDNGQHLLLGAYGETLKKMRQVGAAPQRLLERRPLSWVVEGPDERFELNLPRAPAPVAVPWGFLRARDFSLRDRLRALASVPRLRAPPRRDCDVATWLDRCGQPAAVQRALWAPLCLAALNAPPERASARVLARVLDEAFRRYGAADLLLPRVDLGGLFPRPARDWLARHGAQLQFTTRVRSLEPQGRGWRVNAGDATRDVDHVVLATGARATARLLPDDPGSRALAERLQALGHAPITTVYLRYPPDVSLPVPMVGRLDGPGQWIFDRRLTGQDGVMAVVISGDGEHMQWPRERVADAVQAQLAAAYPHWPAPRARAVVREKRATFDCVPGCDQHRVHTRGPCAGLWFAGDHVATGLPATIEGAVRAGVQCARELAMEAAPLKNRELFNE
ncbi:MAG: hydroxysqualene dehydroxylase HpnE [Halofilum sp. (in: g-proteobacteria)]